jgi:hypothetical protein
VIQAEEEVYWCCLLQFKNRREAMWPSSREPWRWENSHPAVENALSMEWKLKEERGGCGQGQPHEDTGLHGETTTPTG